MDNNLELELEQEGELELEHEAFIYYFLLQAKEASCCENEAALGSGTQQTRAMNKETTGKGPITVLWKEDG
jgi:hypothetical protein